MGAVSQWHCWDPQLRPTLCHSHHTTLRWLLGQGHPCGHCQNGLHLDFYFLSLVSFSSQLPLSHPFFFPIPLSLSSLLSSFSATKAPQITLSSQGAPSRLKGLELLYQDVYNHKRMSSWCLPPIIIMSWVEQVTCPYQEKHWGLGLV